MTAQQATSKMTRIDKTLSIIGVAAVSIAIVVLAWIMLTRTDPAEQRYEDQLAAFGVAGDGDYDEWISIGYELCETRQGSDAEYAIMSRHGLSPDEGGAASWAARNKLCP